MTEPTGDAWEDRCTDCDDTGITIQTERRCACQPPLDDYTHTPPVSMDEVEAVARAIRIRALETADMDESEQWFAEQFARAALAAMPTGSALPIGEVSEPGLSGEYVLDEHGAWVMRGSVYDPDTHRASLNEVERLREALSSMVRLYDSARWDNDWGTEAAIVEQARAAMPIPVFKEPN